ncbi:MAG: hypothetical protein A2X31_02755 [Elusimicrobia bacterium GWB2_63_22]|nr:MAG: hypothetical protein A2X31_02755 [Elusimicrobia bacterium GWB2_63_22]
MAYRPSELNSPWSAFGWRRSLLLKLLLTGFWTALVLAAGLYGVKKVLEREPAAAAAEPPMPEQEDAPLPAPERLPLADAGYGPGPKAGSLALVKKGTLPEDPEPDAVLRAARPRLRPASFGSSGGNFASAGLGREAADQAPARARIPDEAVVLNQAALKKKIAVKGARPVSAATAKRYSGIDLESEALRLVRLRQEEALAASYKQLRREQLTLSALISLLIIVLTVLGSRVIHALRLIEKPDGSHWTLK